MNKVCITASIVVYENKPEEVMEAAASFLQTNLNVHLYIIDNSITDSLSNMLISDRRLEYLHNHQNPGFGAAHNIAISKSLLIGADYHLVLNPDVKFKTGVIDEIYNYMELNKDIGNLMPCVKYYNGEIQKLCKLLPTPADLVMRRFATHSRWSEKRSEKYELSHFNYNKIMEIPNLSGCFMFIRNSILKKVGGFDERFFMYMEDVDLNRRINKISKTVFYPKVTILHKFEKGSHTDRLLLKYHIRSAIKYFNKWGWLFDKERNKINKQTLNRIKYNEAN